MLSSFVDFVYMLSNLDNFLYIYIYIKVDYFVYSILNTYFSIRKSIFALFTHVCTCQYHYSTLKSQESSVCMYLDIVWGKSRLVVVDEVVFLGQKNPFFLFWVEFSI